MDISAEHTNIGISFNPEKIKMKDAKQIFFDFLNENKLEYSNLILHSAPMNYHYRGCIFKNIYLAGDAAGLIAKVSGEGISEAIISGEEIGRKILNPNYKMPVLKKMIHRVKNFDFLYNIFHLSPFILELSIKFSTKKHAKFFHLID